jgi:DNA-binding beta-propeller fold protein YncE
MLHASRIWNRLTASVIAVAALAATAQAQDAQLKPSDWTSLPSPYKLVPGWAKLPASMNGGHWGEVIRVSMAPDGNVWVFHRCFNIVPAGNASCAGRGPANPPLLEFDPNGNLIKSFGAGMFVKPHGFFVDREGNLWASDMNNQATVLGQSAKNADGVVEGQEVLKISPDGKILMTLGTEGQAGTGPDHFDQPTGVAANGDIFVSDGHGGKGHNSRIVKFSKEGKFIKAWGEYGSAPGQFSTPHDIFVGGSRGYVYVADRSNNRMQVFDQDGKLIAIWKQFGQPSSVFVDKNDNIYTGSQMPDPANPDKVDLVGKGGQVRGILVGDAITGKLKYFIPEPSDLTKMVDIGTSASGITVDDKGDLFAADVGTTNLRKYVKVR